MIMAFISSMKRKRIGIAPVTQLTHVRNKNSNIKGGSLNAIKLIFHTIRNNTLFLSFKRSSHFEKGRNYEVK